MAKARPLTKAEIQERLETLEADLDTVVAYLRLDALNQKPKSVSRRLTRRRSAEVVDMLEWLRAHVGRRLREGAR